MVISIFNRGTSNWRDACSMLGASSTAGVHTCPGKSFQATVMRRLRAPIPCRPIQNIIGMNAASSYSVSCSMRNLAEVAYGVRVWGTRQSMRYVTLFQSGCNGHTEKTLRGR